MMGQWLCGYGNVSGLFIINAKNFEFRAKIILLDFVFLGQAQFPELNHLLTGPELRSANRARCRSFQYRLRAYVIPLPLFLVKIGCNF